MTELILEKFTKSMDVTGLSLEQRYQLSELLVCHVGLENKKSNRETVSYWFDNDIKTCDTLTISWYAKPLEIDEE